jgi:hypothetical protein
MIEKGIAHTPRKDLILITLPSMRRQHLVRRKLKDIHTFLGNIFVKFPSLGVEKLWKNTWRRGNNKKGGLKD